MENLTPVPEVGQLYWFYANDQKKKETEYRARVVNVYEYAATATKFVYRYDSLTDEVINYPVMDAWIEEAAELFWILSPKTDYIVELYIPELTNFSVYIARDLDGGWHSFETVNEKQFGFLDITGEIHNKLYKIE